jgi:hypothetical protein
VIGGQAINAYAEPVVSLGQLLFISRPFSDAVEVFRCANENLAVGDGRGAETVVVETVLG